MAVSAARLAAQSLGILPRKRLSRMLGRIAGLERPQAVVRGAIDTFVRVYGVDLREAEVPDVGFTSFDQFFTRRLRPGARSVATGEGLVVSPADGRVDDGGTIGPEATLHIKGRSYRVAELLGDEADAATYEGGTFCVVYLAPRDYHRVHAPVSGTCEQVRHIGGTLYPVNAIGVQHVDRLFARNERVAVIQRTASLGRVATVLVGALGVGHIELSFDDVRTNTGRVVGSKRYGVDAPYLERGAELGAFHLGSTVIVFVEPRARARFVGRLGARVRYGEAVMREGHA